MGILVNPLNHSGITARGRYRSEQDLNLLRQSLIDHCATHANLTCRIRTSDLKITDNPTTVFRSTN